MTANATFPVALIKPDTLMDGTSPDRIGGAVLTLQALMPKLPGVRGTELGVAATVSYMREGAMLLSDKDYPLFAGDFQPGFAGALVTKVKLSSIVDFSLLPAWIYQSGTVDSHHAIQLPMSLLIKLGEVVQTSADLGIYTGDGYSFSGDKGGRISAGGSLTVKLGPIVTHAGAGVASLLTGGLYPTIKDSVYLDVNVKYAK